MSFGGFWIQLQQYNNSKISFISTINNFKFMRSFLSSRISITSVQLPFLLSFESNYGRGLSAAGEKLHPGVQVIAFACSFSPAAESPCSEQFDANDSTTLHSAALLHHSWTAMIVLCAHAFY